MDIEFSKDNWLIIIQWVAEFFLTKSPGFFKVPGLSFYRFFIYGVETFGLQLHLSNPLQRNSIYKK